jgi:predicted ribosome quality control (RQC) complex YloA/Tae2 family protein
MAFDGFVTHSIVDELNKFIIDGKINRVFEPNKNEIIFGIYNYGVNYALNISICADNYRMNLTTKTKPNPINAPGFCMLLRKHIIGGKIKKIYMPGLERIVVLELECYNELNDLIRKKLVIELMGKHSNIILLNENNIIIDSLRHLDSSSNSLRDILPAHPYEFLESNKNNFLDMKNFDDFYKVTCSLETLDGGISNEFIGISKLFIQNIIEELNISNDVTRDNLEKIYNYLTKCLDYKNIYFKQFNKDYSITLNGSLEGIDTNTPYLNFYLDDYYFQKENENEFLSYRNSILKLVEGTLKKITKKLANINNKLKECDGKDTFQLYGEILTANLYKFKEFDSNSVELENYYTNEMITIPVDKNKSPSENVKIYFKKYNKLKNALEIVNKQKKETIEELKYIESILYSLENAKNVADVDEIFTEIKENDLFFSKKTTNAKSSKTKRTNKKANVEYIPIEYKIENYTFLVGKNNKQNDYLSTKILKSNDLWFHVKEITSSHGILITNNTNPPMDVVIRCAQIVAYYSKARQSSNVPVDYALGKYVKKPSSAKPGMVIYTHNSTVNVQPKQ